MLSKPYNIRGNKLEYPEFLRLMLSDNTHSKYTHFCENIRSYNSALSFTSLRAKITDCQGRGPYVLKVHGQTYHETSHIRPSYNKVPQFAQLYVLDSTQATDVRQAHAANVTCEREILDKIDRVFLLNTID